jgi:hypothetical protein
MAVNPTVKCPGCKQDNAVDMAFCIFCGAAMKATGAVGGQSQEASDEPELRICPKCECADPLNREYCIICGTKIPKRQRVKGVTSSVMVQSELMSLREDISTIQKAKMQAGAKPFRLPGSIILFALALVGLGLGAVVGICEIQQSETAPPMALPQKGLAILTAVPYCDVFIEFPKGDNFIIGRTSRTGALSLVDLYPEQYAVEVKSPDGENQIQVEADVENGKATVLGGPPGKRLFEGASQTKQL